MDPRRHGKLPLSSQTSETKEKEEYELVDTNEFDAIYASNSNWCSNTDLSTMVSGLSQVIGTSNNIDDPNMAQPTSSTIINKDSQPLVEQGLFLVLILIHILVHFKQVLFFLS